MNRSEVRWILVVVLAAALFRLALAFVIPPFQAPDERAHVDYVAFLVEHRRLPVQPERSDALAATWQQSYQPPLAYLAFAPLWRALHETGLSERYRVFALRAQNAIYGVATVATGFWLVLLLTPPGDPRRVWTILLLAFVPGFAANTSAVNNDGLANLLAALLWVPLLAPAEDRRAAWGVGVVFGTACLAKLTALALWPIVGLLCLVRQGGLNRRSLRDLAIVHLVAAAVLAPWMVRNQFIYGNPLAIGAGSLSFSWLETVFPAPILEGASKPQPLKALLQFWGRFGIYNNVSWAFIPSTFVPLLVASIFGWLRPRSPQLPDRFERTAPWLLAALVVTAVGLANFSLRYYGGWQGRYLYPAMVPCAALLAGGWTAWIPRRLASVATRILTVALALLALGLVFRLSGFFTTTDPAAWGLRSHL